MVGYDYEKILLAWGKEYEYQPVIGMEETLPYCASTQGGLVCW